MKQRTWQRSIDIESAGNGLGWRADLSYCIALKCIRPHLKDLVQRILRESGFTQVDVTGGSGDGGIDGIGVMRLGGFLSFRVLFQCKRWKGS